LKGRGGLGGLRKRRLAKWVRKKQHTSLVKGATLTVGTGEECKETEVERKGPARGKTRPGELEKGALLLRCAMEGETFIKGPLVPGEKGGSLCAH